MDTFRKCLKPIHHKDKDVGMSYPIDCGKCKTCLEAKRLINERFSQKGRKKCPVCRFHKNFEGPICAVCLSLGYRPLKNGRIKRRKLCPTK